MLRISIPTPCHEQWAIMTPVEKGAYCQSCAKTVTDFTGMSDRELAGYFRNNKEQKTCGRFLNTQLNRTIDIVSPEVLFMDIPAWKKYLAILFICFSGLLISCKQNNELKTTEIINNNTVKQTGLSLAGFIDKINLDLKYSEDDSKKDLTKNKEKSPFEIVPCEVMGSIVTDYRYHPKENLFPYPEGIVEQIFGTVKK